MSLLRPCIHVCSDDLKIDDKCLFCASNSGKEILLASNYSGKLYAGYDPGGMVDPAGLVVVEKVPQRQYVKEVDHDNSQVTFSPAFRVLLVRSFLAEQAKKKNVQADATKGREGDLYTRFNVEIAGIHKVTPLSSLVVDSTGIGSPIISHCRELGLPADGMIMHRRSEEEIFSNLRILLEQRKVELPDNYELLSSLNSIIATPNRIGEYSFSHPNGTHDDLAFALALAVWKAGRGGGIAIISTGDEPPKRVNW